MFGIEKISLSFYSNSVYFILGLLLIAAYSIYVYRYTIPQVNPAYKIFLVSLRTLALIIILFAIFEPILSISRNKEIKPVNLVFIDNSKSILIEDGTGKKEEVNNFIRQIKNSGILPQSELYTFGNRINNVTTDSLGNISFNESVTNFSKIFGSIEKKEANISSIILISDGVITDGSNPLYQAEKSGTPVFTIGVGDTTKRNNIEIKKVLFNEYIYVESPTVINIAIANFGFRNKSVSVTLSEDNRQIGQQTLTFDEDGISNLNFDYNPKSAGEKKLTLSVNQLEGESSFADNKRVFYINVLNNKLNTLILAGSPSPDLSFIKNALISDENLKVLSITQVNAGKFIEPSASGRQDKIIDSSDILFLIGFPSQQTPDALLEKVIQEIKTKNKPYFFVLSAGTDVNKLRQLQSELPFTITQQSRGYSDVQPVISMDELENPLLQNNAQNIAEAWNNLPPVSRLNSDFQVKAESKILARVKINNIPLNNPLILTRKLGNKRSIAVLAKDIWKWKLQLAEKKYNLFDSFILNSVKWLNTSEDQKQVTIRTTKKTYSPGESVEFTAQVYDETFNPIDDAEIDIDISSGGKKYSVYMNSLGNGIYEGTLVTNNSGDYQFTGSAKLNEKQLGKDGGKFSIGDVDIEMINPRTDKEFLTLLANQTGGNFFYGSQNYGDLFEKVIELTLKRTSETIITSEFVLWSNEWMLILIVLLFALEWFFRKRAGMI